MNEALITIPWLIALHLVTETIFRLGAGRRDDMRAAVRHAVVAGLLAIPISAFYGPPGFGYAFVVGIAHLVIDLVIDTGTAEESGPGLRWSPIPAARVAARDAAHLLVVGIAWAGILAPEWPSGPVMDAVRSAVADGLPPGPVAAVAMVGGIAAVLILVNGPFAAGFIALLLPPPGKDDSTTTEDASLAREPRVGRVIGVFERFITVILVIAAAEAAVALVGAVKTLARFRQLEDRWFAEYYLLGTLASLACGFGSGLLARWWLGLA